MESLIAYVAAECPAPMVIMFPDRGTLDDAVETHLYPTFEQTRPVRSQLPAESLRNRRRIQFARCSLRLANAGSPASVSGFPARYVFKWEHEKTP